MKPTWARFLLTLVLILSTVLSACSAQPRTVTFNNETYRYQQAQGTVVIYAAPDGKTLQIEPVGDGSRVTANGQVYLLQGTENQITVTFPDGRELMKQYEQNASSGGTAPGVEASLEDWNRVDELREIVFHTAQNQRTSAAAWRYLLGAVVFGIGLLEATNPRLAWQISEGWRYANVEPSELYLGLSRLAGVVMMLVALFITMRG